MYRWDLLSFIRKEFSSLSFPLLFFFFLERDRMRISTGQLSASSSDRAGKVWWQVSMIRDDPWSINEKDGGGEGGRGERWFVPEGSFDSRIASSGCTLSSAIRQIGSVFNEGDRARESLSEGGEGERDGGFLPRSFSLSLSLIRHQRLDYRLPCTSPRPIWREIDTGDRRDRHAKGTLLSYHTRLFLFRCNGGNIIGEILIIFFFWFWLYLIFRELYFYCVS